MTGGGMSQGKAAGGSARHVPVLLDAVMRYAAPRAGETFVDATFGAGGYARALLDAGAEVVAIDRDPDAIAEGRPMADAADGRLTLVEGRFSDLDAIAAEAGHARVDGVVLDVGVSSMQLDRPERGFSFSKAGPLDMRMDKRGPTAGEIVNALPSADLAKVIAVLGEERRARSVAAAIDRARKERPLTTTRDLAEVVARAVGRPNDRIHPATRTFQALRIFVNRELGELADALGAAERVLSENGRLVVVAFHSLEDRIVKRFLAGRSSTRAGASRHRPETAPPPATFDLIGTAKPSEEDVAHNPRARSARLRAARRTNAPARALDAAGLGVPDLGRMGGA